MPPELAEYDTFDYTHFDDPGVSLEEATGEVRRLRAADPGRFHRIVPKDQEMTRFRVESVPVATVYAELLNRCTTLISRFTTRSTKR